MMLHKLKHIFDQFDHHAVFETSEELASGHINDTFLIKTREKPFFVLQRINHDVFKDVPGLMQNKVSISQHIRKKLSDRAYRLVLTFVKSKQGNSFYFKEHKDFWCLSYFIENCITHDIVQTSEVAYEGGQLVGEFLRLTDDFDSSKLVEVISKFHDMSYRFSQFEAALKGASEERLDNAERQIKTIQSLKAEMHILQNLKEAGKIKIRVTHNDTKISNILFTKENKGLCVIDTDTVMPGIVHYDFGDAIRTICNTAAEDETNLDLVRFNIDFYKAYAEGFLKEMRPSLSPLELKYLPLGAKTMIFIMALRFLTDYLNNDVYYKTAYAEHNLDRSKNQLKLIESFDNMGESLNLA
ncbi:aminoglycoside phosphotransferase family protein [Seonamhaeicola sp.]|uniref:phosphotransferase enzyme family protein n=1 Tax=Seonamhaeicola sp. TaxID=1912245 RepID=UPI00260E9304|nr:aminoglycoside phosphotransferase family protein [Seonamhaeicola sp.]